MPRLLHLAGHRDLPQYFDIDDSTLFDSMFTGGPAGTPATPPQPTPPQAEPAQAESAQTEPAQTDPAQTEPRIPPTPAAEPVAPPATDSSTA
jgi:hypothetical protein